MQVIERNINIYKKTSENILTKNVKFGNIGVIIMLNQILSYEKGVFLMNNIYINKNNENEQTQEDKAHKKSDMKYTIITTVITTMITTAFLSFFGTFGGFISNAVLSYTKQNIKEIAKEDNSQLSDEENNILEGLKKYIDETLKPELTNYIDSQLNTQNNSGDIEPEFNSSAPNTPEPNKSNPNGESTKEYSLLLTAASMTHFQTSKTDYHDRLSKEPKWTDNDTGTDIKTGKRYKIKSLANKPILLFYTEGKQEIYFYGQFNKKNHWNGDCIINVYENNELILINEANYSDGKLTKKYKQVFFYNNGSNKNVWAISNRKHKGEENIGDTQTYLYKPIKQSFKQENVTVKNIISVSKFKTQQKLIKEGFYHGKTSNGYFNDKTGKAYMIKYGDDKKIRLLYCGKFENGNPQDHTNSAWSIVIDNKMKCYVWQQGYFSNGYIDHNYHIENNYPLTKESINMYIKDLHINKKHLNWNTNLFK